MIEFTDTAHQGVVEDEFKDNMHIDSVNMQPVRGEEGNHLPDCWNEKQASHFRIQYKRLDITNGKLGCQIFS